MLFKAIIVGALVFYLFRVVLKPKELRPPEQDHLKNESRPEEVDFTDYEEID